MSRRKYKYILDSEYLEMYRITGPKGFLSDYPYNETRASYLCQLLNKGIDYREINIGREYVV